MSTSQLNQLRIVWSIAIFAILGLTLAGVVAYLRDWDTGVVGVALNTNESGSIILAPVPGRDAAMAGIQPGDALLAINGTQLPKNITPAEASQLLRGKHGEPVTLMVMHPDGETGIVIVTRSGQFLAKLASTGVSLGFYQGFNLFISSLSPIIFVLLSAWLILKKQVNRMAGLAGLTLMILPFSLNLTSLGSAGAASLNMYWFYALIRTAGLFSLALFLFAFPDAEITTDWNRLVLIAAGIWLVPFYIAHINRDFLAPIIMDIGWLIIFGLGILSMFLRFRSAASDKQKSSLRSILQSGTIALATYIAMIVIEQFLPSNPSWQINYVLISQLVWSGLAIFFGFQMARNSQAN